jgi:hypothetical protein
MCSRSLEDCFTRGCFHQTFCYQVGTKRDHPLSVSVEVQSAFALLLGLYLPKVIDVFAWNVPNDLVLAFARLGLFGPTDCHPTSFLSPFHCPTGYSESDYSIHIASLLPYSSPPSAEIDMLSSSNHGDVSLSEAAFCCLSHFPDEVCGRSIATK